MVPLGKLIYEMTVVYSKLCVFWTMKVEDKMCTNDDKFCWE